MSDLIQCLQKVLDCDLASGYTDERNTDRVTPGVH